MPATSPFCRAFAEWYRSDVDRLDTLWLPPDYDERSVRLHVRRFEPHVYVHLDSHNANVGIEWECEGWDYLYADDVVPERGVDGRWSCGECPRPAADYDTRGALWAGHLFAPIARWLEQMLMPAEVLYFSRYNHCTWGTLAMREAVVPAHAVYAVYASGDGGEG